MKLKSNEPFFLLKNGLKHSYPSVYEDLKTDILIVGCGITGSLIAHQCMEDGWDTLMKKYLRFVVKKPSILAQVVSLQQGKIHTFLKTLFHDLKSSFLSHPNFWILHRN